MQRQRLFSSLILAVFMVLTARPAFSQTNHSGDIMVNQTWYASGNPHIVEGDIRVFAASGSCTLTVMPGAFVKFDSSTGLQIGTETQEGVLMALGTADSTIFFGSNQTTPGPGDWQGIIFEISGGGRLEYATITQGGYDPLEANLTVSPGAGPVIDHSTIEDGGGYGLVCMDGALPVITGNTFQNNGLYPVQIYGNGVPLVDTSNVFAGKGPNAIEVLGDEIVTSAVWPLHGIPYVIAGDLQISKPSIGDTLTLLPGTILQFESEFSLRVGAPGSPGFLLADGDTSAIVFTAADTAKSAHWAGIYFSSQGTGFLDSCSVSFGGYGSRMSNIYCATLSDPTIQNCAIQNSRAYGLVCADAALPTIVGNHFSHNGGHPVSLFANYVPLIDASNVYADNGQNAVELKGDYIINSVTWLDLGIPFALAGDVSVFKPSLGDTLTLQPGVTLAFDPGVQLRIGQNGYPGTLLAPGLTGSTIAFTSSADTASPGDWADIFCDSLGTAVLEHCLVEYGGGGSHSANVYVFSKGNVTLDRCIIRHSGGDGITCWNSDATRITGCLITANQTGLHCYGSDPVVKYNHIAGNDVYGATNDSNEFTVDATGNWWGHATGPQDLSSGPPSYNPAGEGDRVTDYVAYDPWWQAPLPTLLSLVLGDPSPTRADTVLFTLTFDRLMEPSIDPLVTISPANPLEGNTVAADSGWAADSLTWTGSFVVTDTTGDGWKTITASGAQDLWGWSMSDDDTYSFFIDTHAPEAAAFSPAISAQDTFLVGWTGTDPSPSSGIASFDIYVSEDDSTWSLWLADVTDSATLYPGEDDHVYYFFALAADSAGNMEDTATAAECTTYVDALAPDIPNLLAPADGAVLADTMPTFGWSGVTKKTGKVLPGKRTRQIQDQKGTPVEYQLQCSASDQFDSLLIDQDGLTDTVYTSPKLDDGIYYWRVSAADGAGHTSGFAASPFSFQVDTQPPVITGTTPWPDTTYLGPFTVSAVVEDQSQVGLVLLWYRTTLDTVPMADTMAVVPESKGVYMGAIPEQEAADSVLIEYYIDAQDVAVPPNIGTDPPGAPDDTVYAFMAYGPVSVEEDPSAALPQTFVLEQNYPNPFNAQTVFRYRIPVWIASQGPVTVTLDIYNVRGQLVRRLVDVPQVPGAYDVIWNGTDSAGRPVGSGIYLCRLQTSGRAQIRKAVLLR